MYRLHAVSITNSGKLSALIAQSNKSQIYPPYGTGKTTVRSYTLPLSFGFGNTCVHLWPFGNALRGGLCSIGALICNIIAADSASNDIARKRTAEMNYAHRSHLVFSLFLFFSVKNSEDSSNDAVYGGATTRVFFRGMPVVNLSNR